MTTRILNSELLATELSFETSRAGGPGGQNVNKVNSKVGLRWNIRESKLVTDEERALLLEKLSSRISADGTLLVVSQEKRSQLQNKEEALTKFDQLLKQALFKKKKRKATKPSKGAVQDRLQTKKKIGDKKKWRRRDFE